MIQSGTCLPEGTFATESGTRALSKVGLHGTVQGFLVELFEGERVLKRDQQ